MFPNADRAWQSTQRDAPRHHYWHLARRHLPPSAQTSRIRGGSFVLVRRALVQKEGTPMAYQVFDTTLRDGAQREGISYSVVDKLAVARLLDDFGVGFIEGGWPGALPKDTEFFRRARTELNLKHALFTAFGATRKAGTTADKDPQ